MGVALVQQPEELLFECLHIDCVLGVAFVVAAVRRLVLVLQVLLLLLLQQCLLLHQAAQHDRQRGSLSDSQQCRLRVQMTATVRLTKGRAARAVPGQRRRRLMDAILRVCHSYGPGVFRVLFRVGAFDIAVQ